MAHGGRAVAEKRHGMLTHIRLSQGHNNRQSRRRIRVDKRARTGAGLGTFVDDT